MEPLTGSLSDPLAALLAALNVNFVVQADGHITDVRVTTSSGAALLDLAGRAALGRISGRLRPPKILGGRRIRSSVKLAFELQ